MLFLTAVPGQEKHIKVHTISKNTDMHTSILTNVAKKVVSTCIQPLLFKLHSIKPVLLLALKNHRNMCHLISV